MLRLRIEDANKEVQAIIATLRAMAPRAEAACVKAINATLREIRTLLIREAQGAYTVKAQDLRRKTSLERATARHLLGTVTLSDRRGIGLINFQARPAMPIRPRLSRPAEGVSVKVLRQGARKHPRKEGQKAFVATGRSGNTHLFVRIGERLEALYGPHPIQALNNAERQRKISEAAMAGLERNLTVELERALEKIGGRK